jgi:YfiH family protein
MIAVELPTAQVRFSTRAEGNLSSSTGEQAERAAAARELLCGELGLRRLLRSSQVHGATVLSEPASGARAGRPACGLDTPMPTAAGVLPEAGVPTGAGVLPEADGCVTSVPGVGATMLVADCLPVALGARGAVAMLHGGWRGLAAGVLEEGVRVLRELGGQGPISAAIGPCAGVCCYEVGEEVHAAFGNAHRQGCRLDLRALACERLLAAGVADIRDVELCTICEQSLFSHRREGVRAGRQAGVAWLS